jgi:nucleotide-binding universal stress UspA family protein
MMQSIAHPTDFSPAGLPAFLHALRLAVEFKARLDLLHVRHPDDQDDWPAFPHVRDTLARWGLLPADASIDDIAARLGVAVRKIEIRHQDAIDGIVTFLFTHRPDLIVVATHGSAGPTRWLSTSVSETVARKTHAATLFFGPAARPFVNALTGALELNRVLLPLAHDPSPLRALHTLHHLLSPLAPQLTALHIGETAPLLSNDSGQPLDVHLEQGPVVETILDAAQPCDLIAMPTAGHHGFLDALRGSTTEQVLRRAPCPVLALPA